MRRGQAHNRMVVALQTLMGESPRIAVMIPQSDSDAIHSDSGDSHRSCAAAAEVFCTNC